MLTFPNITPEVFARVLDELRKHSTVTDTVMPSAYRIFGNGVDALVEFVGYSGDVHVKIVSKPFFVSEGMIRGKIEDAITAAQRDVAQGGV